MHERPHASHKQHPSSPKAKAEASRTAAPTRSTPDRGLWHSTAPAIRLGVQRQAVIGEPGDAYEQEADAAAERVVAGEAVPDVSRLPAGSLPTQRRPLEEEEELIQPWAVQRQPLEEEEEMIQPWSVQRQVEEEEEEELIQPWAVQRQPEEEEEPVQAWPIQRQVEGEEEEELIQPWLIQRQPEEEEEAVQAKDTGPAGGSAGRGGITPRMTHTATQAVRTRGPGTPMQPGTRHTLEARFGTDLSGVRVHTDPAAAQHAEALRARAFTHRSHIWLGPGESQDDLALMAHETTHVLQQDGVVRRQPQDEEEEPQRTSSTQRPTLGSPTQPSSPTTQRPADAVEAPTVPLPAPGASTAQAPAAAPPARPQQTQAEQPETEQIETEDAEAPSAEAPQAESEQPAEGEAPAAAGGPPAPGGDGAAPAGDVELLMPEPPASLSEGEQARVEQVQHRAGTAAGRTQALPPAETSTSEARGAVEEPERETQARAENALVDALGERPEPSPEIEELCDRIYQVIRSKRPPDEDSLVDADPEAMAQDAGGQLESSVEGDTQRVAGEYDTLNEAPEGTPQQEPQAMTPPPETVATPNPQATQAAPDPVPAEDVSLDADVEASQHRMDDAGMTSEPAELVQSGPIAEGRAAQGELEQTAEQGPAEVLAEQEAALASSQADMAALQASALESLTASRQATVRGSTGQQRGMVGSEEQMRERVSAEAQQIFTDAQTQVNRLLEPLTRTAMSRWETGVARLSTEFRQHLDRVERWIDERHSGLGGAIVGVWDAVTGLPDWVVEEYDEAEQAFGDGVCTLIREISTEVNGVIATCEAIIENARTRINDLFAGLPAELQEWAAAEQARFGERLDGLHDHVQQTRDDFNRDLAQRASQAVQDVRQEIHELREAAGGLIGRIASAIEAFLDDPIKFIIEGLLELVGISPSSFWALVNRIGEVLEQIADDPLGFAENLLAAIGQGFEQFFDNIAGHLLDGLLEWLFSGLGSVGVEIPTDFSLKSIITFFLQLMGITWARVRRLLAKHIGEENVALIERAYEIVANLIELGPEGLFELLKEYLNPQNILNMVLEAAVEFLIEALIRQVTARILMLFNPVGAILQAIEAIYRVLKWIFENAARIFSLIETVVNGIADILAGNIGGMANAVEQALARLVAPVIDFLAGYLGLGDLPEKIADVIRRMQDWVEGILDRVIGFLANQARRLLSAIGLGEDEEPVEEDDPEKAERIRVGLAAIDQEEQRIVESGKLSRQEAEQIAVRVQQDHSVFTSIRVVDGGDTWDYAYAASPERTKEGEEKEEGAHAANWDQVQALIGQPMGTSLPDGYEYHERDGRQFPRRLVADDAQFERLGLDKDNKIKLGESEPAEQHPSRFVADVKENGNWVLLPNYRGSFKIRTRFYGAGQGYNRAAEERRDALVEQYTDPNDATRWISPQSGQSYPKTDVTVEHDPPVSDHWSNLGGNATNQQTRRNWFTFVGRLNELIVLPGRENAGGVPYTEEVTLSFRGPGE